jgi:CIC family chloride channel protein
MFPWVFGAGYGSINLALNGHLSIWVLLGLIFIKPLATSITLGSGGSGGSFTPALFIGAVGGGFFGSFFGKIFPVLAANASGYAMVGMGALIAGTIYAPITAIIMVFELSANYQIILPLMLCCLICSQLTSTIQKTSIYTHRLSQKGIDLAGGINQNILKNIPVSRQMKRSQATVLESASLGEVMKAFKAKNRPFLYVLDDQDTLQGHISFADILQYLDAQSQIPLTTAGEFANKNLYYVFSEDDLVAAMQLITETGYTELPVLDDSHSFKYLGVIREQDIYVAYQNVLQKKMITHQE